MFGRDRYTYAAERLQRHLETTGAGRAALTDAFANVQVAVLRDLLRLVEAACHDEGVDQRTMMAIVDRVIYGGVPSPAAGVHAAVGGLAALDA